MANNCVVFGSIYRRLWNEDDEDFKLLTCCDKLILDRVDGKWTYTAYIFVDIAAIVNNSDCYYESYRCQKCMEQRIYQQYRYHTDLSKLEVFEINQESLFKSDGYTINIKLVGQPIRYYDVITYDEALRLLGTNQT